MPLCPSGHTSADTHFCDVCGDLMEGAQRADLSVPSAVAGPPPQQPPAPAATVSVEVCPNCGLPRSGRFCEEDGYDFELRTTPERLVGDYGSGHVQEPPPPPPPPAPPTRWAAVVSADRAYYDSVIALGGPDAPSLEFPGAYPERQVPLFGSKVLIGRRSQARGIIPDVDLTVPPADPGVSHTHAILSARPDGTWDLVDPGSTNGTTLNGATDPIAVNSPVPVGDGDRIHVGAWTTITLSLRGEGSS